MKTPDVTSAESIAYLHYFGGGVDAYITEKDSGPEQDQAFGLVDFGHGGELGYVSLTELTMNGMELELYWTPKTLADIQGN